MHAPYEKQGFGAVYMGISCFYVYIYKRIAEEWLHMYSRDREVYAALLPLTNINIYPSHGCNACLTNEQL